MEDTLGHRKSPMARLPLAPDSDAPMSPAKNASPDPRSRRRSVFTSFGQDVPSALLARGARFGATLLRTHGTAAMTPLWCAAFLLAGCTPPKSSAGLPAPEPERIVRTGQYRPLVAVNRGRLVGTVTVEPRALAAAGLRELTNAEAQALEADGTVLGGPVPVDKDGHFVLEGLKPSRMHVLVVVKVRSESAPLRLSALVPAPRKPADQPALVNAGTTFVADRVRRGVSVREVEVEVFKPDALTLLEDVTLSYMDTDRRFAVVTEPEGDFNAFAFDHFADDHPGLKRLVFQTAPGLLRGWRPEPAQPTAAPLAPIPTQPPRPPGNTVGPPVIPS